MTASRYSPRGFRPVFRIHREGRLLRPFESIGFVLGFFWQVLAAIPFTLTHYRYQTIRVITDLTWGRGAVFVGGGTVPLLAVLGVAMGALIGVESFTTLNMVGLGPLTGIISSYASTRELAPIAAAIGFAAQAGCRMTAEIGAQRISEEIDAIESMGLRSIPFIVTTRVIAGAVALVPTFLITLILSYTACRLLITTIHGQSSGVYDHYFLQFVSGPDILAAVGKTLVFGVVVIVIHCYQGYYAAGGPEGVGVASGRAVRASFVAIIALNMLLSLVFWGFDASISFTG
ncbi:ABC transporter permease [Nocardia flavorosea]|uniref:ABC transporter permease n=1 Tax=Nocardia flavorosea TaxID=53429 RepID=A0A846YMW2_9NOCA|nr:ABC transporter permease [Nocardia flavorosea]NKY61036.1 ABC transporter permease [Nocardia flavorosea]